MKSFPYYEKKPNGFWWTRSAADMLYFFRELTGVVIAGYVIYFVVFALMDQSLVFFGSTHFFIMNVIAAAAAFLHTLTWLWVTTQVTPFDLPKTVQIVFFIFLVAVCIGGSYFLFTFLYAKPI